MTFSARQWRKVSEQLYNSGEMNLSGRIAHEVGHIWNGDNWDEQVTIDFSAESSSASEMPPTRRSLGELVGLTNRSAGPAPAPSPAHPFAARHSPSPIRPRLKMPRALPSVDETPASAVS